MLDNNRAICGPVMVVDDDPAVVELVRLSLSEAGHATCCATSGAEAMAVAAREAISAAVVDVNLPDRSGYEVCRELRRLYGPCLPIVFVSGDRREAYDRIGGLLLGADDYLVKPFDPRELVARLETLIRRARAAHGERPLTPRELEVLTLLAEGLTQLEIAGRLVITSKTVATHIERILGKLGVRSRAQAVAFAYRETLVSISA
jgi:DNA-binding NarL/FixJ family response regulator